MNSARADRAIWLLRDAFWLAKGQLDSALDDGVLKLADYGILASLDDLGPASQTALAQRLRLDPSNLVNRLDALESAGWVERNRDPGDRRRNLLELTRGGKKLLRDHDRRLAAAEHELLAGLTSAEQATLIKLLKKLGATCE